MYQRMEKANVMFRQFGINIYYMLYDNWVTHIQTAFKLGIFEWNHTQPDSKMY